MNKKFTTLITSFGIIAMLCFVGLRADAQNLDGQISVCQGTTEVYTTQAGESNYIWAVSGGTVNVDYRITEGGTSDSNSIGINWLNAGNFSVSINYDGGTLFGLNVTVKPVPIISFRYFAGETEVQGSVCHNTAIRIDASATGDNNTFYWFDADLYNSSITDTPENSTTAPIDKKYPIMVTNNITNCINYDTARVVINPVPVVDQIGGDNGVCEGSTVELTQETTGGTWVSMNPTVASVNQQGVATGHTVGSAEIRYTVSNTWGCENSASINLTVKPTPTLQIFDEQIVYDRTPRQIQPVFVQFNGQNVGEQSWVSYEYYDSEGNLLDSHPVDAGVYTVYAVFEGNDQYCGAANGTAVFTINPANLNITTIDEIPNQLFTGSAINPDVVVRHGITLLEKDAEYTVRYENNINVGQAKAIVTGIGNYNGQVERIFNIVDKTTLADELVRGQGIVDNDRDIYSDGSIRDLENAISAGVIVYDNPYASQAEIDAAVEALRQAMNNLIECIPFNSIVTTRWNNTLTVSNNPANNGNHTFQDNKYQWFRKTADQTEFAELQGETRQYYSAGPGANDHLNAADRYYVTMYNTNNEKLSTCAGHPTIRGGSKSEFSVSVYPNPVFANNSISVDLSNEDPEDLKEAVIDLYSTTGVLVSSTKVTDSVMNINVPDAAGIYIVKVRAQNIEHTEKVVVK